MTSRTYSGSRHCRNVRYQAEIHLARGATRCISSHCTHVRAWFTLVQDSDDLRLIRGAEALADYSWTPPGRSGPFPHFRVCRTCGTRLFARGGMLEAAGAPFYAVAVASLDDVEPDELAAATNAHMDGGNDRFTQAPADSRLM